jgi:hypothetical protein
MNTFKKKALFAALTGLGVMGMVGSAQAVSVNPDGLGQALIYPYYTVRASEDGNAFNSLISVVNSTSIGKAVKVRFIEGKRSAEVLDFNLYMSREDVWTGAVIPTANGAALFTQDTSCTNPPVPRTAETAQAFRNYQYTGPNSDLEDPSLNRAREGYVEVIEMADIRATIVDGAGNTVANPTWVAITHATTPNGWMPPDCNAIRDGGVTPTWATRDLVIGSGGLFGSMTVINPNDAQGIAYEATALDGFYAGQPLPLWYPSGSINPNLSHVRPRTSTVIDGSDVFITPNWQRGIDPVSAVLMHDAVYNEFMMDDIVAGRTDWVVTFPTKSHYYTRRADGVWITNALFQRDFVLGGACDDLSIFYADREERRPTSTDDFSPPPHTGTNALCWETNVITFGQGKRSILNSQNDVNLGVSGYSSGWAKLSFPKVAVQWTDALGAVTRSFTAHELVGEYDLAGAAPVTSGQTTYINLAAANPVAATWNEITFTGMPMVGFAVQQFNNGEVMNPSFGKVWASYATRINHRFSRKID